MLEMASACVTNSPESFLDCPPAKFPSYGWLSPRISFSRDNAAEEMPEKSDLEISGKDFADFEFRLEDPVTMLPADELFSDGKLVPLQLSNVRPSMTSAPVRLPDTPNLCRRTEISGADPYLFSPKAPTCSMIHWKQLLRLKKLYQKSNGKEDGSSNSNSTSNSPKAASSASTPLSIDKSSLSIENSNSKNAARSLKFFLHRNSKSSLNSNSSDPSVSIPFLKDSENELVSISSRLSLSSSSSGHEHEDIPRLSLDSDKASTVNRSANHTAASNHLSRIRVAKLKQRAAMTAEKEKQTARRAPGRRAMAEPADPVQCISADSPRMNHAGKIVFQSLERSSSSPSTFNGGPRYKHKGVERSYSAKVRITPVLNVPVCSLSKSGVFGLPLLKKREPNGGVGGSRIPQQQQQQQQSVSKSRTERS